MVSGASKMSFVLVIVAGPTISYHEEINKIKEKVAELISYEVEFDTIGKCEEFIRSVRYEYILLIVTSDMINEIFTQNIHHIRHVQSIFLFDPHVELHPQQVFELRQSSYKMQDALLSLDDLYQSLWKWVQEFANGSDVLFSTLASCPSDAMTTNVVNNVADFAELWYPLYIDFLLDLPIIDSYAERCRFVEQCRIYFARNPGGLKMVEEFEVNYTPAKALNYYTRDRFVYRLVNRALRRQAIDGIISFRFLLHDIQDQLRLEYKIFMTATDDEDFFMTFYRGQRMSEYELNELKKKHRAGTLITTNSYFSTSMKRDVVKVYLGQRTEQIVPVLFEITVQIKNYEMNQRKPFAFIGTHSQFVEELEVLFSIGSFFKINKIFYNESDLVWIVQVTFIDDNNTNLEITKDFRTLQMCPPEVMIIKIGNLLANHPQHGTPKAVAFYKMIMSLHFSTDLTASCYIGLGWLALKEKDAVSTIKQQLTALEHYERLVENGSNTVTHLRIMCYNCIGTAFRLMKDYDQALNYFLRAQNLDFKIPIDKYAMYDGYRNITTVNIASIHKLMNHTDLAWDTYKQMLAHEMSSCIRFHGHTYLTIAQAGLQEAYLAHDADEYQRCSLSWKAFLDLSLSSMSSSYRRSIISGVLLLGLQYADCEQTRTMAIDCFKKVITNSQRYVSNNRDDRLIVLQCQNQVSRLYTKMQQYEYAIDHSLDALQICTENDLTDIAECYESMAQTYEHRLSNEQKDLTPEDISRMILFDNPFFSISNSTGAPSGFIITFERSEFTFGQLSTNIINPTLLQDTDRKRQLAYCLLKIAALVQMQGYKEEEQAKIEDDDLLRRQARGHAVKARQLLHKVIKLLPDNLSVQKICAHNLTYLDGNFDSIIDSYTQDLNTAQQKDSSCIGEDAFCYIAHLYARKTNINEEHRWYDSGVKYFLSRGHICEHTTFCFNKLAHFYEKHNNFTSAIDGYENLVRYLIAHNSHSFLRSSINPIVMRLVQHCKKKDEAKRVIVILQQLVKLISAEPDNDECRIDEHFKLIIAQCTDDVALVAQVYTEYLEVILRHKSLSPDSDIRAVEPAFRQAISAYQTHGNHQKAIETCRQFVGLLISTKTDRLTIEAAFKRLALDFESLGLVAVALDMYTHCSKFIIRYQKVDDLVLAGFVIVRCKLLKQKDAMVTTDTRQTLVHLMVFYHNVADPQFVLCDYLKTMKQNIERHSATGIYMSLLELCMKHRSDHYNQRIKTSVTALVNRPKELIAFVTANRTNYITLILSFFELYGNRATVTHIPEQTTLSFEANAEKWLLSKEDANDAYWSQLLHCLLEWQSIDDECLASCYAKMGDMNKATSVFDIELYGDPALKFCSNACRRYLEYVYPQASSEQRINLEHRYCSHFCIECDSFSEKVSYEILPIE